MSILGMIGASVGNKILGNFTDKIFGASESEKRQFANEKEMMGLQAKYNEELAGNNQQRAKELWNYTNYENQKEHLINAGLNPALLYGQSGGGGASTSGAGQASGVGNPGSQAVMMGIQAKNIEAQTNLANAQAKKAEAEAAKTSGTDTEESQSRISLNETVKEMNDSLRKLNESNTRLSEEQAETEKAKQEELYSAATNNVMKAMESNIGSQIKEKELNNWEEAFATNIALQASTTAKQYSEIGLNKQQINTLKAEVLKWENDVRTNWRNAETHRADVINKCNEWMSKLNIENKKLRYQLFGEFIDAATGGISVIGRIKSAKILKGK